MTLVDVCAMSLIWKTCVWALRHGSWLKAQCELHQWYPFCACYRRGNSTMFASLSLLESLTASRGNCNIQMICIQWLGSVAVHFVNCKWVQAEVEVVTWCCTYFHCPYNRLCRDNLFSLQRALDWGINRKY